MLIFEGKNGSIERMGGIKPSPKPGKSNAKFCIFKSKNLVVWYEHWGTWKVSLLWPCQLQVTWSPLECSHPLPVPFLGKPIPCSWHLQHPRISVAFSASLRALHLNMSEIPYIPAFHAPIDPAIDSQGFLWNLGGSIQDPSSFVLGVLAKLTRTE